MDLRRTIATLLALTWSALLVVSGAGCSRDPQNAADSGKKIDLTLPKPAARAEMAQKPADKIEAAADKSEAAPTKKQTQVEVVRSTVDGDPPKSASSTVRAASASAGKIKKQARKQTDKQRAAVVDSQQQRRPVGDGVPPNDEDQESPSSDSAGRYRHSDDPLHPSYKKK